MEMTFEELKLYTTGSKNGIRNFSHEGNLHIDIYSTACSLFSLYQISAMVPFIFMQKRFWQC